MIEIIKEAVERLIFVLEEASPSIRQEAIAEITSVYCKACGEKQSPGKYCQCENDE